jgi:hypothetical protein
LPVPDMLVIRTRVISSELSRPLQANLIRPGSGSSQATSKHAGSSYGRCRAVFFGIHL